MAPKHIHGHLHHFFTIYIQHRDIMSSAKIISYIVVGTILIKIRNCLMKFFFV